jgi:hypothetical protein
MISLEADQPGDPAWGRNLGKTKANTEPPQGACQLLFPPLDRPTLPL